MCIYIYIYIYIYMYWDHTNPPHPHHPLFNEFKFGYIECNNLLNTHTTELVHRTLSLLNLFKSDVWGWGGFVWSPV